MFSLLLVSSIYLGIPRGKCKDKNIKIIFIFHAPWKVVNFLDEMVSLYSSLEGFSNEHHPEQHQLAAWNIIFFNHRPDAEIPQSHSVKSLLKSFKTRTQHSLLLEPCWLPEPSFLCKVEIFLSLWLSRPIYLYLLGPREQEWGFFHIKDFTPKNISLFFSTGAGMALCKEYSSRGKSSWI